MQISNVRTAIVDTSVATRKEVVEIFTSIYELAITHKKAFLIFIVFELWVHSLMFQHLKELKSIWQLIPFF